MPRPAFRRITNAARLRWLLGLMFLGLAIPAALLVRQGFARLELEEFRRQQLIAESVEQTIDSTLAKAIAVENARPVTDFQFAVTPTSGDSHVVQLSPLSSIAPAGAFPGTIGYFQVDAAGQLSTPLLPESEGARRSIQDSQIQTKIALERQVAEVLEANQLVSNEPDAAPSGLSFDDGAAQTGVRGQDAFDRLGGAASESVRPALRQAEVDAREAPERARLSVARAPATPAAKTGTAAGDGGDATATATEGEGEGESGAAAAEEPLTAVAVSTFAGEIEPLRFNRLETGHIVLYRNAWRDGQRYIQGLLIDVDALIRPIFAEPFRQAGFAAGTSLTISIAGETVSTLGTLAGGADDPGSALYAARLSPPLSDITLEFAAGQLDRGPGFNLLVWTTIALVAVLLGGFASMYLFGMQQLRLAREQRNFVSAVSHELKTPLTSIRMYGEMLRSGWADEAKKTAYYDFIVAEGERLSRLIENVLQLARMNNGGPGVELQPMSVGELVDLLRSKLQTQAERAGFALEFDVANEIRSLAIMVDADALTQVFINLVDNAIKFSVESSPKTIVLGARRRDGGHVLLTVRDFGPGIPPNALRRLFELFYRPDNELTRTTTGTGIGLALVRQLVTAMRGRVDVRNCEPGAEFGVVFPLDHTGRADV